MDIKEENEHINLLCHGCLTTDRKLRRIRGEFRKMFLVLRNDDKVGVKSRELQLCWECIGFLKKLKMFRARIRKAESLLVAYLQNYYNKDKNKNPECLSSLKYNYIDKYTYEFNEEEKSLHEITNEEKTEQKEKEDQIEVETIAGIKVEHKDTIKEEYDYSNDNDSEYNDTEFKIEKDENVDKSRIKNVNSKKYKRYENIAIVTLRKDVVKKDYCKYVETVCLSQKEYENVLKRDRKYIGTKAAEMKYRCNKCCEVYLRKLDLLRHKSFHHNEKATFPYKCAACETMITSSEHLEEHWTERHTVMLKCTLCSEAYYTKPEIKHHIYRQHTKNYGCQKCGLDFETLPEFKKHYKVMHEIVICDYCNGSFRKKRSLLCHMRRHHIPAYCKLCDRVYINHKSFKYHNMVTHPDKTCGETRKELSYCVECDKQYPSVYKYRRHLQQSPRHTQQRKIRVPCPECGKVFTRTNFMRNHFRLVHLKVTKNYCEQCDKYYATAYGLRQHVERFHKKIAQPKDKFCDLCGRGFGTNKILQNHRRTHTGERPYKCNYCPAAFAQETAMKTHQKSQHKNLDLSS